MTSTRQDGRGHWPRGQRRNHSDEWPALRKQVKLHVRDRMSIRQLAERLGVSDRTVRRWLSGQHFPSRQHVTLLKRIVTH